MEFSEGLSTHRVPFRLHALNRERLVERFRQHGKVKGWIVLQGAPSVCRFDTDHEPFVRQESFFQWAFGVKEPDFYGAINVETGKATLFIPRLPESYAVWMGEIKSCQHFQSAYEVEECMYVEDMERHIGAGSEVFVLEGKNTDSGSMAKPASFAGIEKMAVDKTTLFPHIVELRVIKTPLELDVMRYVARVSSEAHCAVMREIHVGMMEYQLEALFRFHCHFDGGCRQQAYQCICAAGLNGATLHYGHAGAPNDRQLQPGQMVLLDMGGEYHCYCSDITCSYPVEGRFTADQKRVYEAVYAANRAVQSAMKPGVSWLEMHRLAERTLLEGLIAADLLVGPIEALVNLQIASLFMPHGLGHLLGLDTHDVGGWPPQLLPRPDSKEGSLSKLRCGRVLQEGMVITVEPGCYFLPLLLEPALSDPLKAPLFRPDRIRSLYSFGGVRIEDDCIVTASGCENMSASVPRSVADIEAYMAKHNPHVRLPED